jgi:hypothetical protein
MFLAFARLYRPQLGGVTIGVLSQERRVLNVSHPISTSLSNCSSKIGVRRRGSSASVCAQGETTQNKQRRHSFSQSTKYLALLQLFFRRLHARERVKNNINDARHL